MNRRKQSRNPLSQIAGNQNQTNQPQFARFAIQHLARTCRSCVAASGLSPSKSGSMLPSCFTCWIWTTKLRVESRNFPFFNIHSLCSSTLCSCDCPSKHSSSASSLWTLQNLGSIPRACVPHALGSLVMPVTCKSGLLKRKPTCHISSTKAYSIYSPCYMTILL